MAKRSSFALDSGFFLQLCLGLFFLALGIMGLGNYNSKLSGIARFFGRDDSLRVVAAVIELVMGIVLVLGLFLSLGSGLARVFSIALFALWALYILYYFVFNGLFKPDFVPWLYEVAWRSIVLVALWIVGRKYMD
jgi:hypothetical protein